MGADVKSSTLYGGNYGTLHARHASIQLYNQLYNLSIIQSIIQRELQ